MIMFTLLFAVFIVDSSLNVHLYLLTALAIFKFSSVSVSFGVWFLPLH